MGRKIGRSRTLVTVSSGGFNEELGYSVLNPGIELGTEFAPPGALCDGVAGPGDPLRPRLGSWSGSLTEPGFQARSGRSPACI